MYELKRQILIRADDVGYSRAVNYGIADSVWNGIIRSVGIMPNMPQAVHGIELLKGSHVCCGQHTNLCLGKPCADPHTIPSLIDESGNLKSSKSYRDAWKKGEEFTALNEVVIEIEAQYQRYLELMHEKPHYFEAHAVMSQNLFKGLAIVAEKYDLPLLTIHPNGQVQFKNTTMRMSMESMAESYDPFASLKKVILQDEQTCMFVCHPGYIDAFLRSSSSLLVPRIQEVEMLTSEETKTWLSKNQVDVITYDDLR